MYLLAATYYLREIDKIRIETKNIGIGSIIYDDIYIDIILSNLLTGK